MTARCAICNRELEEKTIGVPLECPRCTPRYDYRNKLIRKMEPTDEQVETESLRTRLAAAEGLLRDACEAYRTGYISDLVPNMRLLYLSDRWYDAAGTKGGAR
jgi:hypothetical protein